MKYAYNNNGVLQDVVMTHPSVIFPFGYADQFIEVPDDAQNGWLWDGVNATEPVIENLQAQVPQQVSMRQARLALLDAGLLDDVEAIITAAGRAAQIEWEYAATVDRNHPVIAVVQQQQDMTDSQIDALFISAAAL